MSSWVDGVQYVGQIWQMVWSWLWGVLSSWPFVAACFLAPFILGLLWYLMCLFRDYNPSYGYYDMSDTGLTGIYKRHLQRKHDRSAGVFAENVIEEDPDLFSISVDGQRFYRPGTGRTISKR